MQNRLSIILSTPGITATNQPTNQRTQSAESPWLHSFETGYMKRYVYPWETGKNSLENRPSTVFFLLARFPRAIVINLNHQPREPTRTDSTTPSMYVQKGEEISENRDFWSIQKWSETVFHYFRIVFSHSSWKKVGKIREKDWKKKK